VLVERPTGGDMPYVCDNSWLNWTNDDEPIPPKTSDFVYMLAQELGGPAGPAKLRIPMGNEPREEFEDPQEARANTCSTEGSGRCKSLTKDI